MLTHAHTVSNSRPDAPALELRSSAKPCAINHCGQQVGRSVSEEIITTDNWRSDSCDCGSAAREIATSTPIMAEIRTGLTIFLIRNDQLAAFEKAIAGWGYQSLPLASPLDGYFIPLPSTPAVPRWVTEVRSVLENPSSLALNAQAPAGLLTIRRAGRTFAVTFGHAWQKLDGQWLERDFGRRVALNAIPRNQLVEIRAEQVFAKWHLASERAPRASPIDEFGVEMDRDLVGAIEGVPSDTKRLGKTVRGSTSFRVHLPFKQLVSALDRSKTLFGSDAYKTIWPEIDNISPVKDDALILHLEATLDVDLQSVEARKRIAMFTPGQRRQVDWSVDSYVFGRRSASPAITPYLTVEAWVNFLKKHGGVPSVGEARATPVHLLDDSDEEVGDCTVFDCFGCEVSHGGAPFVLSSGTWYEVVQEFLNKINRIVKEIPTSTVNLPTWNQVEDEGEYNERCGKLSGFSHFDAKTVMFGGAQSKFEFCDLLHMKSKTLFFVKIASKSSGMSHLLEQVRRTSELFFSVDGGFRRKLSKSILKRDSKADVGWLDARPRQGDWKVCMVSLGRPSNRLPFFAKCGLAKAYKDLQERGHDVSFVSV
jgi:uncharacterized protein (TIGR04141 family)